MAMSKSGLWTPVVTDDCDWTQVGDPVKRRQIQNRISKRRQRERLRQQKAKEKEVAAQSFERMIHDSAFRRNSSVTLGSSPGRHGSVNAPRWRGHSSPPETMTMPDWQTRPTVYEESQYTARPRDISVTNYVNPGQSTINSASSSQSAPASYWPQAPVPPSHQQTPYTEQSRSPTAGPGPYRSPTQSRQPSASEPVAQQLSWPSVEVREHSYPPENARESRYRYGQLEAPIPTMSQSTGIFPFSQMEAQQPIPSTTTAATSGERLDAYASYSQSIAYPTFESAMAEYWNRYSP